MLKRGDSFPWRQNAHDSFRDACCVDLGLDEHQRTGCARQCHSSVPGRHRHRWRSTGPMVGRTIVCGGAMGGGRCWRVLLLTTKVQTNARSQLPRKRVPPRHLAGPVDLRWAVPRETPTCLAASAKPARFQNRWSELSCPTRLPHQRTTPPTSSAGTYHTNNICEDDR
jgi:hypothetical protein